MFKTIPFTCFFAFLLMGSIAPVSANDNTLIPETTPKGKKPSFNDIKSLPDKDTTVELIKSSELRGCAKKDFKKFLKINNCQEGQEYCATANLYKGPDFSFFSMSIEGEDGGENYFYSIDGSRIAHVIGGAYSEDEWDKKWPKELGKCS
jgi:hypothetical protein